VGSTTFRPHRHRARPAVDYRYTVSCSHDQNDYPGYSAAPRNYCHSPYVVCCPSSWVFAQSCRSHTTKYRLHILAEQRIVVPEALPVVPGVVVVVVAAALQMSVWFPLKARELVIPVDTSGIE
jgi:hypothetical protein